MVVYKKSPNCSFFLIQDVILSLLQVSFNKWYVSETYAPLRIKKQEVVRFQV